MRESLLRRRDDAAPSQRRVVRALEILLSLLLVGSTPLQSSHGQLLAVWDPNTESDLLGYYLYYGTSSGDYSFPRIPIFSRTATSYLITGLDPTRTYYVALTAIDTSGNESDFSNEASGQPRVAACGDGWQDPGEQCDDGNVAAGDGCSPVCTLEVCGNGILDPGEGCDDGNTTSGDGCSATCQVEIASPVVTGAEDAFSGTPYLMQCVQRTIWVFGSNFRSGASVSLTDSSITVVSTTFVKSTQLTAVVRASATTVPGTKTLRVTNSDGSSGTVTGSLSVEVVKNPDFSRNGKVGAEDFNLLAIAFGSQIGSLSYDTNVDMDGNNLIDGKDLNRFVPFLGLAVTSCP